MLLPFLLMAVAGVEPKPAAPPAAVEEEMFGQLLTVRRVYIDRLTGARRLSRCAT
jgi:hypothetical protein